MCAEIVLLIELKWLIRVHWFSSPLKALSQQDFYSSIHSASIHVSHQSFLHLQALFISLPFSILTWLRIRGVILMPHSSCALNNGLSAIIFSREPKSCNSFLLRLHELWRNSCAELFTQWKMNNSQQYFPSPRLWNIRMWRGFYDNRAVLAHSHTLPLEIFGANVHVHVRTPLRFTRTIAPNLYTVVKFSFHSTLTSHKLRHMTESKRNLFCSKAYLQIKHELWILNHPHFSQSWR